MPPRNRDSLGGRSSVPADDQVLSPQNQIVAALALIVVAIFIAYSPALGGALLWNDTDYVTKPKLQSLNGLARIWFDVGATEQYYPLLHSFFWVQYQFWGDWPIGYHVVNLLLHAAAVCLLYLILQRLKIPGAMLAAAIFALHPVMVESVAWITEQKNTLSTVFYLGSLLVYLHFDQMRKPSLYVAALVLYLLAMASKTVTATLPAALLVIFWWQRGKLSWRRDVLPLAPWFALGIAAGFFTAWVEFTYVQAKGADFALSLGQRILIAGQVPWFYAGKLLWPANLIFMYPRWNVDPNVWWQWLFPLATVVLFLLLWIARLRWRGPLAGCLLFVGTLVPVLGFLNVYWFVFAFAADHLQYLASLALIVLAAAGISQVLSRLPSNARGLGNVICVGLLIALGLLTWRQARMYRDDIALYEATLDKNPACWLAHSNLGIALANVGRVDEAIAHYQTALELKPNNPLAQNNFGITLARQGRQQEAIEHYQQALAINPNFPAAHTNLGIALLSTDRTQEAIARFQLAIRLDPNLADAHHDLGVAYGKSGRLPEAVGEFELALQLDPRNVQIYTNLMTAYAQLQRPADVIRTAERAAQLARQQGQSALAQQIAAWLANYRANLTDQSGKPDQSGKAATPKAQPPRP